MQKFSFFLLSCAMFLNVAAFAQQDSTKPVKLEEQIRQYWFVMLTKGSNRTQDSATAAKIQAGHLANIDRLYEEGKIKVAGPFGDKGNWLGIFIFDCATKEEVETLLATDPAVSSGRLAYDIRPWWTAPIGSFKPGKPEKTAPAVWTDEARKNFISSCIENAKALGEEKARKYCECMLPKVEARYPNPLDTGKMTMEEGMQMAKDCMK